MKWTPQEIEFICDNFGYMTHHEVAQHLNRSAKAILCKAYSLMRSNKLDKEEVNKRLQAQAKPTLKAKYVMKGRKESFVRDGDGLNLTKAMSCIIPSDQWDGNTGIDELLRKNKEFWSDEPAAPYFPPRFTKRKTNKQTKTRKR